MKNNIKTVADIVKELSYILDKNQKKGMIVVLVAIILSSLFELLGVSAILPFIQTILTPEELFYNPNLKPILEMLNIVGTKELMMFLGVGIIFLYIIKNLYMIFSYYIQVSFATKIQKEFSIKMLTSYMSRPYSYFLNANSSEVLRGCVTDTNAVYNILSYIFVLLTEVLTLILIGGFIIYTDMKTAVRILVLMGVVMLGMVVIFKPIAKRAGKENRKAVALKNKSIYQIVQGIKEIYVMQRKSLFVRDYEGAADLARKAQKVDSMLTYCPDRIIEGICVSGLIGIICVRLLSNDNMADFVPKLAAFAMSAFKILPSIGKITSRINSMVYYRPSLTNVYRVMKEAEKYENSYIQYAREHGDVAESNELHFEETLKIQDVIWQYDEQKEPVLVNTTLEIRKGQSIALIGASGAGKTTLADIILGLLKPQKGTVLLDDIDVFAMPKTWARIVGYVPQSVFLIDDTVRNNVAFGMPKELIDDNMVWNALERAQLKNFVESLPQELDTIVGERGVKFSGGQRQRVAIARALYENPDILVLDEATAALDNETESAVMEAIDALQGSKTLIIVAHRLSTVRNCDKIYEIKDGIARLCSKDEIFGA